ncbi:MAG: amidohydrolase family protein, partial [Betaproteobacteria bacterium]|nr:amidohydrolase family protein [Betaproteobacteria bacterium]
MSSYLFQNGAVINGAGDPIQTTSVLVEGDRITHLGAQADDRARHLLEVQRIDLSGKILMPGLIDAHCHLSFDDASSNPEIF